MRFYNPSSISIEFNWNGNQVQGQEGDTVASALHAAGIRYLSPSRKFHQPRGLSGSFVAGHLATVNGIPNCRLENVVLQSGMDVRMQGVWPSAKLDIFRLRRLIPKHWLRAGFEHPRFIPDSSVLWKPWERSLALAAGGALPPSLSSAPITPGQRIEATTVIIGGGPAGQQAARTTAESANSSVVLITRGARPADLPDNIKVYSEHQVFALYDGAKLVAAAPLNPAEPALLVDSNEVILATGARSVPPLIEGAALPGVLDASMALRLARKHGLAAGKRVLVIGTARGQAVAEELSSAGGVNIIDYKDVSDVISIKGRQQVTGIELKSGLVPCDAVVHAGPWRADPKLPFQAAWGGELRLMAGDLPQHLSIVGSAAEPAEPISFGANVAPDRQALICPCMDVTVDEVQNLVAKGITHVEEIKHRSGCGMGPCQGVPCWDLMAAVISHSSGQPLETIGHPSYRPPGAAITFAQAAGLDEVTEVAP